MSVLSDFAALRAQMSIARSILEAALPAMDTVAAELAALTAGQIPAEPTVPLPVITGTTYYASAIGDDSAAGTQAAPWKTLDKVNSFQFKVGDAVLLRGGDLFSGSLSGTNFPGQNIISSYGTGDAVIYSAGGHGIFMTNPSAVWIANLTLMGVGGTTNKGIYLLNDGTAGMLPGPSIQNVTVTGYGGDGILIYGHPGAGFSNLVVRSCTSYGNTYGDPGCLTSGIGIWAGGATTTNPTFLSPIIEKNKVYQNVGCTGPNWSGSGIFVQGSKGGVVQFNEAYENGSASNASNGSGPVGIWTADSDGLLLQFNESHHNSSLRADGGGFDLDGGVLNCLAQFNYAHDNRNYGIACYAYEGDWGNNTIRYNILVNNIGSQLSYGGTGGASWLGPLYIYNNTLIGDARYVDQSWHAVVVCPDWEPQQFYKVVIGNNLIDASAGGLLFIINSSVPSTTLKSNAYIGSYSKWAGTVYMSVPTWQAATGQDSIAVIASDPGLVDKTQDPTTQGYNPSLLGCFRPASGSPLIGVGVNIAALFAQPQPVSDYYGTALPANGPFNIGAAA